MKVFTSLLLCLCACSGTQKNPPTSESQPTREQVLEKEKKEPKTMDSTEKTIIFSPPWKLHFSDGSGNGYNFHQTDAKSEAQFTYDPVRREFSSSGTYSGGEPVKKTLSGEDVSKLQRIFTGLVRNKDIHGPNPRPMGTGYFKLTIPTEEQEFVILNGPELKEFTAFAKGCRE